MNYGFFLVHRKIEYNEFYFAERFTKIMAWMDLIMIASHSGKSYYLRGVNVTLKPGEIGYSIRTLAKRWKWNERTVMRYLRMLEIRNMIEIRKSNLTNIIKIIKYIEYQRPFQKTSKTRKNTTQKKQVNKGTLTTFEFDNTTQNTTQNTTKQIMNKEYNNYKNLVVLLYCKLLKVNPDSSHYGFIGRLIGQERDKLTYLQKCLLICYTLRSLQDKFNNAKIKGIIINTYKETSYSVIKNLTGTREHPNLSYKTETTFTYKHNNLPY